MLGADISGLPEMRLIAPQGPATFLASRSAAGGSPAFQQLKGCCENAGTKKEALHNI
jgi:hypothetical protein